jgi:hypothetical protein
MIPTGVPNGYAHAGDASHVSFEEVRLVMAPGAHVDIIPFRTAWIAACSAAEGIPAGDAPTKPSGGPGAHVACFRQAVAVPQFLLLLPLYMLAPGVGPTLSSYQQRCHERDVARVHRDAAMTARHQAILQRNEEQNLRAEAEAARVKAEAAAAERERAIVDKDEQLRIVRENKDAVIAALKRDKVALETELDRAFEENQTLEERIAHLQDQIDQLRVDREIFVSAVIDHYGRLSEKEQRRLLQEREAATPGSDRKIRDELEKRRLQESDDETAPEGNNNNE